MMVRNGKLWATKAWISNYEEIFEDKREKKLDFIIEDLIENRNLSLDINFDFNPFDLKDMDIATQRIFEAIKNNQRHL